MRAYAWFPYQQTSTNARIRLFCFPYACGSASVYRTWQKHLSQEIEVCPVQLPGRDGRLREPPFTALAPLVEHLTAALLPLLDRPYAFFGHSMGALIGFELTRYLRRQGRSRLPTYLFVSGKGAPQLANTDPPVSHLPEADLIERLRHLKGTPEAVLRNAELISLFLPLIRADFALCETYQYVPDAPLPCPITTFGGLQDEGVTREMLSLWREQTGASFRMYFFDGDHFFLQKKQKQGSLLMALSQDLLTR